MKKIVGLLFVVLFWSWLGTVAIVPIFPPIHTIVLDGYFMVLDGTLTRAALYTTGNVLVGVALASLAAFALSVIFHAYSFVEEMFVVPIDSLRNISSLAIFPVFLVLFGVGRAVQIAVIVWASWSNILISTLTAVKLIDKDVVEAAMLDGADRFQLMWHMTFPLAMPHVVAALRVSLGYGWLSLTASEMIGGTHGLGYLILSYASAFQFPKMYASILAVTVIGYLMQRLLKIVQDYYEKEVTDEKQEDVRNGFGWFGLRRIGFDGNILLPRPEKPGRDKPAGDTAYFDNYIP